MATRVVTSVSLEAGDHLRRDEFHRRYLERPDIKKAELIDGVVHVPSPVRHDRHGKPHFLFVTWLGSYVAVTPGLEPGGDNSTVILDGETEVQPDAFLWRPEAGLAVQTESGYLVGPPHLIVEIAASSATDDLHVKKDAYRRNGVAEYVAWRVLDEAIDWVRLQDGAYVTVEPDAEGFIESEQFPGLRLHVPSMLAGDLAAVVAAVRR